MGKALKGFQDASKEFETEFKKEADRLEKSVAEPMKATLEKPKALDAASEPAEAEIEAEIVEEAVMEEAVMEEAVMEEAVMEEAVMEEAIAPEADPQATDNQAA
jgi:sec-independent protein translocase protein TatA